MPDPVPALAHTPPVRLDIEAYEHMIAHAYDGYPFEACGLLGGSLADATIVAFAPCRNIDESARTYSIGPDGWRDAEAAFDALGVEVVGVVHSHTHTDAYPSPTDIDKADNPLLEGWRYLIVSLRDTDPVLRCYLLDGRTVVEEVVELTGR